MHVHDSIVHEIEKCLNMQLLYRKINVKIVFQANQHWDYHSTFNYVHTFANQI